MGRRNNFLIISLLVMLAVLLGAILFGGNPVDGVPDPALAASQSTGSSSSADKVAAKRTGFAGSEGATDSVSRSRVEMPEATGDTSNLILITGRLTFEAQPAAHTKMSFRALSRRFGGMEVMDARGSSDKGVPLETDAEGRFSMPVPVGQKGTLRLESESSRLFAAAGEGKKEQNWLMLDGYAEDTDLGDLAIVAAASLTGRVVDQAGQPVAGVSVRLGGERSSFSFGGGRNRQETAADGRFEFGGLEAREYTVRTSAPNFVPAEQLVKLARGEARADLLVELRKGGSVSGTVLNDQGLPIAGARVAPYRTTNRGGMKVTSVQDSEAVISDDNGYFRIEGLEAKIVNLRATAKGHAKSQLNGVELGSAKLVFKLERRATISGRVTDSTGNPVADSSVRAKPTNTRSFGMLIIENTNDKTDAEGYYSLDNVTPGSVLVLVEGDGHRPAESKAIELRAGENLEGIDLVVDRGATLDVHVVDHEGNAVEGAQVVVSKVPVQGAGRSKRMVSWSTSDVEIDEPGAGLPSGPITLPGMENGAFGSGETGADGRVSIKGLPDGPVKVDATHAKMAAARPTNVTLSKRQPVEAVMTLRPGGFLDVLSLLPDGSVYGNARYKLSGPIVLGEESKSRTGSTDAVGKALIGPLVAGSYEFVLKLDKNGMSFGEGSFVQISGGAENLLEDSRTTVEIEAGETSSIKVQKPVLTQVSGTVRDADGPVAKIQVRLERQGEDSATDGMLGGGMLGGGLSSRTDRDGKFSIADVAPGEYLLTYKRPNAPIAHELKVFLAKGQEKLERHLTLSGGSIRVEVTSKKDFMPLSRVEVTLRRPGGKKNQRAPVVMMVTMSAGSDGSNSSTTMQTNRQKIETDEDGIAVITDVPPGEYILALSHSRHVDASIEKVLVTDGTQTEAGKVDMSPAGVLRGTVTGFAGKGMMNIANVEYRKLGASGDAETQVATNGTVKIDSLEAGKWQVRATEIGLGADEVWGDWIDVEVKVGRSTRVEIPLPKR